MLTVEKKKKYTVEDYMMLEEGSPFQLVENELIMSPSPNSIHQAIVARLSQIILNFLDGVGKGGYVAVSMDVVFDENNVFQPDVLYVSGERQNAIVKERVEGVPDLVIEILSPSNAYYDLRQKKDVYQRYRVQEYIIVDPPAFSFELYILKDGVYQLHHKAEKTEKLNSVLLPGLSFDLAKIFA